MIRWPIKINWYHPVQTHTQQTFNTLETNARIVCENMRYCAFKYSRKYLLC